MQGAGETGEENMSMSPAALTDLTEHLRIKAIRIQP